MREGGREFSSHNITLYDNVLVHTHNIADSAQPRKVSNVTRPILFLWVGFGDENYTQLRNKPHRPCAL